MRRWLFVLPLLLASCGQHTSEPYTATDTCSGDARAVYNCKITNALTRLESRLQECARDFRAASAVAECEAEAEQRFRDAAVAADREAGRTP